MAQTVDYHSPPGPYVSLIIIGLCFHSSKDDAMSRHDPAEAGVAASKRS